MVNKLPKVSLILVPALVLNVMVGAGVLTLPSDLAGVVGPDAWLSIVLGTLGSLLGVGLLLLLSNQHPKENIAQYLPKIVGSFLALIVNWSIALLFFTTLSFVIRIFSDTVNVVLLRRTPLGITMIGIVFASALIAHNGLGPLARLCQMVLYWMFLPFILAPLFVTSMDLGTLKPVLMNGLESVFPGFTTGLFAFAGFEILLVIAPEISEQHRIYRYAALGVLLAGTIYLFVTVSSITILTPAEVAKLRYPFVEALKYVPVPAVVFERIELLIFTTWIAAAHTTIAILLYVIARHLATMFGSRNHSPWIYPVSLASMIAARIPRSVVQVTDLVGYVNFAWLSFVFGLIPLLTLITYIRKRGGTNR